MLLSRKRIPYLARCFPRGVKVSPSLLIAPISFSTSKAAWIEAGSGGWGASPKNSWQVLPILFERIDRDTSSKGTRFSSGSLVAFNDWALLDENSLMHNPGRTRPARPARCLMLALEHQSLTRIDVAVLLLRLNSRSFPESMTASGKMARYERQNALSRNGERNRTYRWRHLES